MTPSNLMVLFPLAEVANVLLCYIGKWEGTPQDESGLKLESTSEFIGSARTL